MYWLIEDLEQLKVFYNSGFDKAYIEIIPFNDNIHPIKNGVSLVYLRPLDASKGFMIAVDHSEALCVNQRHINEILKKFKVLYTRDKKEILHYFPLKSFIDINQPPNPYIRPTTQTHDIFYYKHKDNPDINKFIPIVKHYELCEIIFGELKSNINDNITEYGKFFNDRVSLVFNAIERNGIRIHRETFSKYFYETESEFVYTQFNLKTTTTRPSNRFNGVNYAALNKDNGCRASFIPRNDELVEIDIIAYHPTLASKLINYEFEEDDIHSSFAKMYNVSRDKAKELTFKQLYGGVFHQYKDLEFFKQIDGWIQTNWNKFNNEGWIEAPVSKFRFEKEEMGEMNPQKLFNYVLQNFETSLNVLLLWEILRILRGCNTKLILYTYDSFLLDVDKSEEGKIEEIKTAFNKYKLNTTTSNGRTYDYR